MPDRVSPNPPSPFADADPTRRHLLLTLVFLPLPAPGHLAMTGCDRAAVVPDEPVEVGSTDELPEGICPLCITAFEAVQHGHGALRAPLDDCRICAAPTRCEAVVCGPCRSDLHDQWVAAGRPDGATLEDAVATALAALPAGQQNAGTPTADGAADHGAEESAGPEAYPSQIVAYCDGCLIEVVGDYVVTGAMTREQRLEVARGHLRTSAGWVCDGDGDFCPPCAVKR